MSDLTFEVTEFFQDRQQRFEAALALCVSAIEAGHNRHSAIEDAIDIADELIAKLNETSE